MKFQIGQRVKIKSLVTDHYGVGTAEEEMQKLVGTEQIIVGQDRPGVYTLRNISFFWGEDHLETSNKRITLMEE